jgi:hypothetical protein
MHHKSRWDLITMRQFKTLALRSTATIAILGALSFSADAQVAVSEDTSEQIRTSTAGDGGVPSDVTVNDGATVTVDSARSGLVLDSDNALVLSGDVTANNIDGTTGVELVGGNTGTYTQTGSISIVEDFTQENTDDDPFTDGGVAEGVGRTGILISGASPFEGNIELAAGSVVAVEGNDSFGINLANTPMTTDGLTGNLTTGGQISVTGDRSIGVNLASNITGNVTNTGIVDVEGAGAQGYVVSGDIDGGFSSSGRIAANGFRFESRPVFTGRDDLTGREDLTAEDLQQAGSALNISGNVTGGVFLNQVFEPSLDADGNVILDENENPILVLTATSSIGQLGSAPAVLIDGNGTPIALGLVAPITNPNDPDFDADLQYGFINQGSVAANGVFNDFNATTVSLADVTIDGGVSNQGTLTASAFRSPLATTLADGGEAVARVLVFGDQAIAAQINNSGAIVASSSEAIDEVFFDRANIIPPRDLLAVAVDIGTGANVGELINTGAISAVLVGREGTAVAIRDASGTVTRLENSGTLSAIGSTSDSLDVEDTNFNLIAVDFSASTNDLEIVQSQNPNSANVPLIRGDILLGSGDDTVSLSAGLVTGAIDFGGGNDTLALSGNSVYAGEVRNTDSLDLTVIDNSVLALGSAENIQISEARIDGTSVYRPVINGQTGEASTLISNGNITFEDGATISPTFDSIIGTDTLTYTLVSAGNLTIGDLDTLGGSTSSFLFDTNLALADPNTLVVTVDLRDPTASVENGGLGLDAVQAAAFGSVVNGQLQNGPVLQALAATSGLGNAFANIGEANEFYAALNQILPEFSGAAKQFVLANVDGAVGAVGSHLDTTRRSPDKPGGAWLQEFFYFADRELAGLSEQYRGEGFGFSGGLDKEFGPFHAVGVSLGFASTEIEDVVGVDEPLDVTTYQAGAYAGLAKNGFNLDLYAGGGISDFEQSRRVAIGDFFGTAEGEWQGVHANASLRAGYEVALSERFWARPSVSLDYLYLDEEGRTETGTEGVRLTVEDRTSETAAATAKLDLGATFQGKRTWIRPSIRVGYRNEFISDPVETAFRFQGLSDSNGGVFDSEIARLRAFAFPDEGILLGFTVAAGSQYSSIGFDFDSDIRDGFIRHTGRVVIRLLF